MKLYKYNSKKLKYELVNYPKILLKIALIYFSIFLFLGLTNQPTAKEYITDTEKVLIVEEMNQFSEETLVKEINKLNFKLIL